MLHEERTRGSSRSIRISSLNRDRAKFRGFTKIIKWLNFNTIRVWIGRYLRWHELNKRSGKRINSQIEDRPYNA